jgi:hypothetical protein
VVPALYVKIARNTKSPQYFSRVIDRLLGAAGKQPAAEGQAPAAIPPA